MNMVSLTNIPFYSAFVNFISIQFALTLSFDLHSVEDLSIVLSRNVCCYIRPTKKN